MGDMADYYMQDSFDAEAEGALDMERDAEGFHAGYGKAIRSTEKALLVDIDGRGEVWLPFSQIHADSEVFEDRHEGEVYVTEWLATQKGWT